MLKIFELSIKMQPKYYFSSYIFKLLKYYHKFDTDNFKNLIKIYIFSKNPVSYKNIEITR